MTARHPSDHPDHEPLLSQADSEAMGRRIQLLTQSVDAPASLRARLADAEADRARPSRAPAWWTRPRIALPAVGATTMAAVLTAVLLLAGGPAGPSVNDAAAVALARPTDRAPAVSPGNAALDARVGGVTFPNYAYIWPAWKAAGQRRDTIDGRAATTVVYRGPRGDVGYTIVDGKPLARPEGAKVVRRDGVDFAVYRKGGATVVTWERGGHTCVLAARGAGVEGQLLRFATWA